MASILTNTSAMTALQTLKQTNANLATTQDRISTGRKVNTASDNAAYWSISVGMQSQSKTISAAQEALGVGKAVVDTAVTGLEESIKIAEQIQAKLATLNSPGVDNAIVNADVAELSAQIVDIAKSASIEGKNLLSTAGTAVTITTGYTSAAGGGTAALNTMAVAKYDLEAAFTTAPATAMAAETTIIAMRAAAATLGSKASRIESQTAFNSKLIDAIDRGVGVLVDADMNAESARLSALQVQQQLGVQGLSIANSSNQSILSLFRG
ncbi:flagellin (plasmid) [Phyllobacterium zundukense]|uniref:flagellin N-terminal helical domain-containing protein n=1 Tax=Phyllobacterium zundukense TaxID=1867719 RepID=UPI000C1BA1B1|nr:flagellin [Phyllobacterium zundukense]ATU95891.1 flagellin [Phyllobacterium zundukense]